MCRLHFTVCTFSFVSVFWCLQHRSGKCGPLGGEFGGAGRGRAPPPLSCAKRRTLARCVSGLRVLGKSQHCQDSVGTLTHEAQLLLPTLHFFLYSNLRKRKNWNILQYLIFAHYVTCATFKKPYLMVFIFSILCCVLYAALENYL